MQTSRTFAFAASSKTGMILQSRLLYQYLLRMQCHLKQQIRTTQEAPSLGHDLWRQLKRKEIPVFHGDKRTYQSWKAAFLTCIDNAQATPEYKLLQLQQYVSGEALQMIESVGHSATA